MVYVIGLNLTYLIRSTVTSKNYLFELDNYECLLHFIESMSTNGKHECLTSYHTHFPVT